MRRFIQVFAITLSSFLLFSCGKNLNEKEKMLVGTWYVVESFEETDVGEGIPSVKVTIEEHDEYCSNKKANSDGVFKMIFKVDAGYYTNIITLEYEGFVKGEWCVEGDYLVSKASNVFITFKDAKTKFQKEYDDVFIELLKEAGDEMVLEMKNEMLKTTREKIVSITYNELTVLTEEGLEGVYTRIN